MKYRKFSIIALLVLGLCQVKKISGNQVRNIILCIGDGMGFNHVALARHNSVGPGKKLHMERLPVAGMMRTYSADDLVTDSAAAGTAMACGIKTNNGMIGMDPDKVPHSSILTLLQKKGWRTGLVATSQISHATPAAFASHVDSRDKQKEIAVQLLNNRVDVLLGGGRKYWSEDLLAEAVTAGYEVIGTRDEMAMLKAGPVIGLFADDGMTTFEPEPSIGEMAKTAIALLSLPGREWFSPKPKFFLMIEGSQIDWAAHANDTDRVIRQTLQFDMAVREAVGFAQRDKHTLVIVTADHETGGLVIETEGINKHKIDPDWEETGHTAADVPVYAFGPGSEHFAGVIDNTEIPKRIAELTGLQEFPIPRKLSHMTGQVSIK
ncbi:MAG: alkaline phosphatase [Planctomycetota bacterium]|jgi:alkaline phosphatase